MGSYRNTTTAQPFWTGFFFFFFTYNQHTALLCLMDKHIACCTFSTDVLLRKKEDIQAKARCYLIWWTVHPSELLKVLLDAGFDGFEGLRMVQPFSLYQFVEKRLEKHQGQVLTSS